MRHFLSLNNLSEKEILELVNLGLKIKKYPKLYSSKVKNKTMLMFFEKPSLRTRISFEVAMNQMSGNGIYYDLQGSPLSKGKETIEDTTKVIAKYCDFLVARVFDHKELEVMSKNSSIPVINALSELYHPCQAIGDLITIKERYGKLKGLTLAYYGDADNNVTRSLIIACSKVGINMYVFAPNKPKIKGKFTLEKKLRNVKADIVYTDSWMSYHIPKSHLKKRIKLFKKYQVNKKILGKAIFMHCLPALRDQEVTKEVMDGKQSLVFEQASNRLHSAKAIILWCMR
jgi:ornithine carbamoyltransferase